MPCFLCLGFLNVNEFLKTRELEIEMLPKRRLWNGFLGDQEIEFRGKPHIWIQWKGTNVCCELRCECGFSGHFDGDFLYFWRCPECKTIWENGTYVAVKKADLQYIKDHQIIIQEIEEL